MWSYQVGNRLHSCQFDQTETHAAEEKSDEATGQDQDHEYLLLPLQIQSPAPAADAGVDQHVRDSRLLHLTERTGPHPPLLNHDEVRICLLRGLENSLAQQLRERGAPGGARPGRRPQPEDAGPQT